MPTITLQPRGPAGFEGYSVLSANPPRDPVRGDGKNGDFWVNQRTGGFFQRTSDAWRLRFSLIGTKGDRGLQGITGNGINYGAGAPGPLVGIDGDFYIQTSGAGAPLLYGPKSSGSWPSGISIVGPFATGLPAPWASATAYSSAAPASYVVYGGESYVCTTSHTSGGSFDASKFVKVAAKGSDGALTGGTLTSALNWATAVTVASATTTDIGAAASNYVIVTGTTTITGLGTIAQSAERLVRFSGALTLTHNATSLILPGAANIVTAAGDIAEFISEGSGNWRCKSYVRAGAASPEGRVTGTAAGNLVALDGSARLPAVDGSQLTNVAGGWTLLATLTASGVATLDDPSRFSSAYDLYALVLEEVTPASSVNIALRVTTDNGSTYPTSGYLSQQIGGSTTNISLTTTPSGSNATVGGSGGSNATGIGGVIFVSKPSSTARRKVFTGNVAYTDGTGSMIAAIVGGVYAAAGALTGFRIYTTDGSNFSGKVRVYGIKTS